MKGLEKINQITFLLLLLWFTLDLIGITGFITQDSLLSLSGAWETILLIILVMTILKWKYADFSALLIVTIWDIFNMIPIGELFFSVNPKDGLKGMYRFFPVSKTRVIPEAYHTVCRLIILVNFVLLTIKIVIFIKSHKKRPQTSGG
jgi:hypothetical protein